jgi:hypothetical protein
MRTIRKIAWLFTGAVAAGIALDHAIDTGPVICSVDPTCRTMTPGEVALARSLFGDTIPYGNVRIFNRPSVYHAARTLSGHTTIASVFRSNMYLPSDMGPRRYDFGFSLQPSAKGVSPEDDHAGDFAHELTHWWQYYQREPKFRTGDMKYEFNLEFSARFDDFNEEQQAEIVRSYFNKRRAVNDFSAYGASRRDHDADMAYARRKIREYCAGLIPYEARLRPVLPLAPVPACGD